MRSARRVALVLLAAVSASCGGGDGITVSSHVSSVAVAPSSSNIAPGGTVQLTATPSDANGNVLTGLATTWTTSNAAAATVAGGLVTAVAAGFASITATIGGVSGTASINVATPTFALTITGAGTGSGTISSSPAGISCTIAAGVTSGTCTSNFTSGASVTLSAAVTGASSFTGWSNACSGTTACVLTMTQARTVTATFTGTGADPCAPITMAFPGTVQGSVSGSGCTSNGSPSAFYRFTATGQGGATFAVTSAFPVRIEVTSDPPGNNVALLSNTTPTSVAGEWLLPPGTFQVRVSAVSGTGAFTLTGSVTQGATNNGSACTAGINLRIFVVGGTYSGQTLNTGDCREGDNSFADYFYIRSLKPCTIVMTPTGFDAYLTIRDAVTTGTPEIIHADLGDVGEAETISLPQCSVQGSGNPIIIEANTFAAGETGAYTLSITITGGGSIMAGSQPADAGAMLPSVIDTRRLIDSLKLRSRKPPPQ